VGSLVSDRTITIDLNAPVRVSDAPGLLRRVAAWWLAQLKALAPDWARRIFPEHAPSATLLVSGSRWRVVPGEEHGTAFDLDVSADDRGLAEQILQAAPAFSLSRLTTLLPKGGVLCRRIAMPIVADDALRSAVELQIDRLSPFKSDAVRFDVLVVDRDRVEGTCTVDVAIAPLALIEAVEGRLHALALMPAAVDVDAGNGAGMGFDLRARKQGATPHRTLLVNVGFAFGAILAWYIAGVSWDAARAREIEGWEARIAELRPSAQRSAMLRQQLDGMTQPLAIARALRPGLTLEIVNGLTQLLPDNARLTELRLTGDAIELVGFAEDAPGLIAKIEASKLFKDVKFRSPVTRRPELNKDRFEMSLRLESAR
jgi:general secretion pathway protein L